MNIQSLSKELARRKDDMEMAILNLLQLDLPPCFWIFAWYHNSFTQALQVEIEDIQMVPAFAQEEDLFTLGNLFLNVFDDKLVSGGVKADDLWEKLEVVRGKLKGDSQGGL